ncbi:MAG: hypothetical protein E7228_05330 [Clostridiales bacterium]|nr:hypothetical protein [Clostridiales bacterium]
MLKRFTGIILALILVFSLTFTCFAEITAKLDIKVSVSDLSYTLMVTASDTEGGELTYQWYEAADADGKNGKLIDGATGNVYQPIRSPETKYYYCAVTSTTEAGSETVNTEVAEVIDKSAGLEDEEEQKEIHTFSIKDIEDPVTGESPDMHASTGYGDPGYVITSVQWQPGDSEFSPETAYTVTVSVQLNENCIVGENFKCLINDKEAKVTGDPSSGSFGITYTFPATEPIAEEEPEEEGFASSLPAPLGIPGWIWAAIIIILIAALIIAIVANARAKKRNAGRHNYVDEIYQEKMRQKETMKINSEKVRRSQEDVYERPQQRRPVQPERQEEPEISVDNNNISYYDFNDLKNDYEAPDADDIHNLDKPNKE